jgi:DNA transformation protein and related proteins
MVRRPAGRVALDQVQPRVRDSMQAHVEDALERLPELTLRRMFGGAGVYSEDTMFGIVYGGRVYLKTSPTTVSSFTERGSAPFRTRTGSTLKSYYEVPAEVLDDEGELLAWSRRALEDARSAPSRSARATGVDPERILEGRPAAIRRLCNQARKLVRTEAPDALEIGYVGWRLIGYRCPHYFCFVAPQADHVRVGFEHGHRLADPDGVLEAMGKQVRFVRLVPGRPMPLAPLRALIRDALRTLPISRAKKRARRRATSSAR